jgi:hypothetical protein
MANGDNNHNGHRRYSPRGSESNGDSNGPGKATERNGPTSFRTKDDSGMAKNVYLPIVTSITNKETWTKVQSGIGEFLKEFGEDKDLKQRMYNTIHTAKPITMEHAP